MMNDVFRKRKYPAFVGDLVSSKGFGPDTDTLERQRRQELSLGYIVRIPEEVPAIGATDGCP